MPFRIALEAALALAALSAAEKNRLDIALPFSEWADGGAIVDRLTNNYARLLDVAVAGEEQDYLLWHGVDIIATFADGRLEPDIEHLCIAILILEGVASDIASANWDPLIERAIHTLAAGHPTLVVCVHPEDFRAAALKGRLYKFHGCAVSARDDEATYRPYIVGRQPQINGWASQAKNAVMANRLIDLIATKPTLMMGLSAQDSNIQGIFAAAEDRLAWPWPGERPSYVFSEDDLGVDQKGLLQNVYRAAYNAANRDQIFDGALIRAYAKPLLLALVLHVLSSKLKKLIELVPTLLPTPERNRLQTGVTALRDLLAASAENDRTSFLQAFIRQTSRAVAMFRDGRDTATPNVYNPMTPSALHQMAADVSIAALGLREAAAAVAILGLGARDAIWTLATSDPSNPRTGTLQVTSSVRTAKVFFAANSHATLLLQTEGHLDEKDEAILIQSLELAPAQARSPRGPRGRTGKLGLRKISIGALMNEITSCPDLVQRFREKVSI